MLERMEKQNRIFSGFDAAAIDRTTAADLAEVGSDKWTRYPGCIGAFIAARLPNACTFLFDAESSGM